MPDPESIPSVPIEGGDFDPGGGNGNHNPPIPEIVEEKDPCEQMADLEGDTSFIDMMEDLKSKTGLDYETGYLLSTDEDGYTYTEINGLPGEDGIDLPNNIGVINGYMHTAT